MSAALAVENLEVVYHHTIQVLRGLSLEVPERGIVALLGANGAGKTTTLKVLMGLIRSDGGRASVLGHDVRETEYRRQVGFLPESLVYS